MLYIDPARYSPAVSPAFLTGGGASGETQGYAAVYAGYTAMVLCICQQCLDTYSEPAPATKKK